MASVLALLSKSFFETKVAVRELGETAPIDRYFSKNKRLDALAAGGSLFLVTVRPPDEALWLVAVIDEPRFTGELWQGRPNCVPITDITARLGELVLDTGDGIHAAPGRLGMSLQTPRILADADVALLRAAAAPVPEAAPAPIDEAATVRYVDPSAAPLEATLAALAAAPEDTSLRAHAARLCASAGRDAEAVELLEGSFIHLNAHDPGILPCLCRACLSPEQSRAKTGEDSFVRDFAVAAGRVLFYWLPDQLAGDRERVSRDVAARMTIRFGDSHE